ncbi:MAG: WS/DGAT domain-containing protein [Microthrixaceae bacterium]
MATPSPRHRRWYRSATPSHWSYSTKCTRCSPPPAEPAAIAVDAFAGLINLLPTSVVARTATRATSAIDFVTSNLRAAPMDTFIAGALLESNYPMGPLMGAAFNLTTMSYRGTLNMGVVIDTGAITEPGRLVTELNRAYRRLLDAKP